MELYKSTDGGAVWSQFSIYMSTEYDCALALCPEVPGMVLFGGRSYNLSILRTTDDWETWEIALNGYPYTVTSIVQNPNQPAHFIASGVYENTVFYHSYDYGATWAESPYSLDGISVRDLLFSRETAGRYLCASGEGIFLTEDGENYTEVLDQPCWALEQDEDRPGEIYAACGDSGVYFSTDDGFTWEPLPSLYRSDIEVRSLELVGDQWLYAGTDGFGAFRIPLEEMGTVDPDGCSTGGCGLRVAESPARGAATVLVPPGNSQEILRVYDISGRMVAFEAVPASSSARSVVLDELVPGVYFAGLSGRTEHCRFTVIGR